MEKYDKTEFIVKSIFAIAKTIFFIALTICVCNVSRHYCANATVSQDRELLEEELLEKQIESFEIDLSKDE